MQVTRGTLNRLLLTLQRALNFGLEAEGNTAVNIERELNEAIVMVKAMKTTVRKEDV